MEASMNWRNASSKTAKQPEPSLSCKVPLLLCDRLNQPKCLFRQRLKALSPRRGTIRARQEHICQPLMYAMIIAVIPVTLDTFAEIEEGNSTASLVMKEREIIIPESHTSESVHRFAAVPWVAAGLPRLNQHVVHDANDITAPLRTLILSDWAVTRLGLMAVRASQSQFINLGLHVPA